MKEKSVVDEILKEVYNQGIKFSVVKVLNVAKKLIRIEIYSGRFPQRIKNADLLINNRAINISLEKGDVNLYVGFAKKLSKVFRNRHIVLYLSNRNFGKMGDVAFDSQKRYIEERDPQAVLYPKMVAPYGYGMVQNDDTKKER